MMANKKLVYAEEVLCALRDDISINGMNFARAKRHLDEAKAVDAVEVVRCKDCKHWTMGYCNHFAYYDYEPTTNEDDFCSYGERREGE